VVIDHLQQRDGHKGAGGCEISVWAEVKVLVCSGFAFVVNLVIAEVIGIVDGQRAGPLRFAFDRGRLGG
jgi:hypothetical protein